MVFSLSTICSSFGLKFPVLIKQYMYGLRGSGIYRRRCRMIDVNNILCEWLYNTSLGLPNLGSFVKTHTENLFQNIPKYELSKYGSVDAPICICFFVFWYDYLRIFITVPVYSCVALYNLTIDLVSDIASFYVDFSLRNCF